MYKLFLDILVLILKHKTRLWKYSEILKVITKKLWIYYYNIKLTFWMDHFKSLSFDCHRKQSVSGSKEHEKKSLSSKKKIKILYYQIKKIIILIFKDFNFTSCIIKIISFKYLKRIYIFQEKKNNVTRNDTLIYELFRYINATLLLITCSNKYLLASSWFSQSFSW